MYGLENDTNLILILVLCLHSVGAEEKDAQGAAEEQEAVCAPDDAWRSHQRALRLRAGQGGEYQGRIQSYCSAIGWVPKLWARIFDGSEQTCGQSVLRIRPVTHPVPDPRNCIHF